MADVNGKLDLGVKKTWGRKAYETLSDMTLRGIMLPTDENYLKILIEKNRL